MRQEYERERPVWSSESWWGSVSEQAKVERLRQERLEVAGVTSDDEWLEKVRAEVERQPIMAGRR